jgi:uncharacterized protein YndB with AHSA1/START domain
MTPDKSSETPIETTNTSLTVRRIFDAPRERVFRAFTDPEELAEWYAPGDMSAVVHDWEPAVDGTLSVSMLDADGSHDAEGTFLDVVENERLVHTWTWTHLPDPIAGRITVEFHDVDGGTEVVLTHEGHPDSETVEEHAGGWASVLENLAGVLSEP